MQTTYPPIRRGTGGTAFVYGLIFGVISAAILFAVGSITQFKTQFTGYNDTATGFIVALFVTPLLAGFLATLRTGRITTGTMAGLWTGFFAGLATGGYILLAYLVFHPINQGDVRSLLDRMAQNGIHIPLNNSNVITTSILLVLAVTLALLITGVILGLLAALIGKVFAPRSAQRA